MTESALIHSDTAEAALAPVMDRAREYARRSKASNTVRAYQSDWRDFEAWCIEHRRRPLPATPDTVALYLTQMAEQGRKPSTITRRVSAISQAHQIAEYKSPTRSAKVRAVLRGHPTDPGDHAPEQGSGFDRGCPGYDGQSAGSAHRST